MRAHLLSMSRMSLAYACGYGFRSDVPQSPRPVGREAKVGSCFAKLVECHVKGKDVTGGDYEPDVIADALELFNSPVRAYLDLRKWWSELGLAYDTARDIALAGPRRGDPEYEICGPSILRGTLDLAFAYGDWAEVVDLKTGKHVEDKEQLYAQAVAASRYFGVKRVRIAYGYVRKTKFDAPVFEELDEDALDYQAGRIGRLLRRLPTAEPERGDHCWRCNAREQCPAWNVNAA